MKLKSTVILEPYVNTGSIMRTMICIKLFNSETGELLEQSIENVSIEDALVMAKTALDVFDMIDNATSGPA